MADMPFEEILDQVLKLDHADLERLLSAAHDRLAEYDNTGEPTGIEPYTPEEVAAMMRVQPLPPKEVIALGLTGKWADMGITDGAEWVNEQKRKRRERSKF